MPRLPPRVPRSRAASGYMRSPGRSSASGRCPRTGRRAGTTRATRWCGRQPRRWSMAATGLRTSGSLHAVGTRRSRRAALRRWGTTDGSYRCAERPGRCRAERPGRGRCENFRAAGAESGRAHLCPAASPTTRSPPTGEVARGSLSPWQQRSARVPLVHRVADHCSGTFHTIWSQAGLRQVQPSGPGRRRAAGMGSSLLCVRSGDTMNASVVSRASASTRVTCGPLKSR